VISESHQIASGIVRISIDEKEKEKKKEKEREREKKMSDTS
jgi:hypothetical protein